MVEQTDPKFHLVGDEPSEEESDIVHLLRANSALLSRFQLAGLAGDQFGGDRKLYSVFGYKRSLNANDFMAKYVRQDITSRIIDAPPGATWSNPPTIEQPEILAAWNTLLETVNLWNVMYRADRLSRLGHYSIILLGFDDTGDLERPAPSDVSALLYARPISSRAVDSIKLEGDVTNPRFGKPLEYKISFAAPTERTISKGTSTSMATRDLLVHHSRIIHIVENPLDDEIIGVPIIERVYNLLDDLIKVAGGTAETYWLTGNRGMQANVDKDMEISPEDASALADEIDEYQHQLRRFIRTRGVEMNVLESTTPSPEETFNMIMSLISGTTGIPKRILIGSEAGQLASEQDRANWAERIDERRTLFSEPGILDPLISALQNVGLIPEGKPTYDWPSAFILSPLEASMTMAQTARAVGNLSRQTGGKTPMQITTREESREIVGLEGDLTDDALFFPVPEEQDASLRELTDDDGEGGGPPGSSEEAAGGADE